MHIAEGYLPIDQCLIWFILSGMVVVYGIYRLKVFVKVNPNYKSLLTISGLLMLLMSFLKFPSVTGSCTHPTGNAFGGVMVGPAITSVLATAILLFESLILGYGGIYTLGANIFSLGIFGPFIAFLIYKLFKKVNVPDIVIVLIAPFFANLATYAMTSFQLALAFPGTSIFKTFSTIFIIFFVTVIPLTIIDCFLSAVAYVVFDELN